MPSMLVTAAMFLLFAAVFLDGFGPRDAERYAQFAADWAANGPSLGQDHWQLRTPLIASLALGFRLLGPSELTASLVCAVWVALLVGITFVGARRLLGAEAGTLAALFTAGSAFSAAEAFEVRVNTPETVFAAAACWCMIAGLRSGRLTALFAAGALAGGAWLCRETAVFLPILFGLSSLVAFRLRLAPLLASSAGFLAVLGAELATYWALTGNPFYRVMIGAGHEARNAGHVPEAPVSVVSAVTADLTESPLAVLLATPNVTPFLLGGLLLLVAALLAGRGRPFTTAERWAAVVFGGGAVLSFVISGYVLRLESPLYSPILPYACGVAAGWSLWRLRGAIGRIGVVAGAASWIVANAAAADFRDYSEYADARWLARTFTDGRALYTDPITAHRIRVMQALDGTSPARLTYGAAPCAGDEAAVTRAKGFRGGLVPARDWQLVQEVETRRPSPTRALLRAVPGVEKVPSLNERLAASEPLRLYVVGPSAAECPARTDGAEDG